MSQRPHAGKRDTAHAAAIDKMTLIFAALAFHARPSISAPSYAISASAQAMHIGRHNTTQKAIAAFSCLAWSSRAPAPCRRALILSPPTYHYVTEQRDRAISAAAASSQVRARYRERRRQGHTTTPTFGIERIAPWASRASASLGSFHTALSCRRHDFRWQ